MNQILASLFFLAGTLFIFISTIGVYKMPDFFTKLQASSKASTLGTILNLIGLGLSFPTEIVITKSIIITFFLIITVPVATHAMARIPLKTGTNNMTKD